MILAKSDPRVHFLHFDNAIDFILPIDSVIFASLDGVVTDVKMDSDVGGSDPKYNNIKYLNYITIKHDNEEYSQYAHLKYKGVLVKVGETVRKGQVIALSGNTGFTTTPHLHFMVFKLNRTKAGFESLEVRWTEQIIIDRAIGAIPKIFEKTLEEAQRVKKIFERRAGH